MNGTSVSDTTKDPSTVPITATGIERMNSPEPSGRASSGRKAKIRLAVQPSTASAISLVAPTAASAGVAPPRSQRAMFSITTMASSTSKPSDRISPATDNWFNVKPIRDSTMMPISSDIGIATITTLAARTPKGSKVSATMASAMAKSCPRWPSRARRLSA